MGLLGKIFAKETKLNRKGASLLSKGRYDEAMEYFEKALEIDPNNSTTLGNKSLVLNEIGRINLNNQEYDKTMELFNEALILIDKSLEIDPKSKWALGIKTNILNSIDFTSGILDKIEKAKGTHKKPSKISNSDLDEKEYLEDVNSLLNEIIYSEESYILGDTSQDERIERLVKIGESAIVPIKKSIIQAIPLARSIGEFENMGLLCEAIGKIGGEDAFESLRYFASLDSNIFEYKFVRIGAIKGLSNIKNDNVIEFFNKIKNNPDDPQIQIITKMDSRIMEIIDDTFDSKESKISQNRIKNLNEPIICPNCESENIEKAKFCAECGNIIDSEEKNNEIEYDKKALMEYWKFNAHNWWEANSPEYPVCDACSKPLTLEDSYYFARWMRCNSCAENMLKDWDGVGNDPNYFSNGELKKALTFYETMDVTKEYKYGSYIGKLLDKGLAEKCGNGYKLTDDGVLYIDGQFCSIRDCPEHPDNMEDLEKATKGRYIGLNFEEMTLLASIYLDEDLTNYIIECTNKLGLDRWDNGAIMRLAGSLAHGVRHNSGAKGIRINDNVMLTKESMAVFKKHINLNTKNMDKDLQLLVKTVIDNYKNFN